MWELIFPCIVGSLFIMEIFSALVLIGRHAYVQAGIVFFTLTPFLMWFQG